MYCEYNLEYLTELFCQKLSTEQDDPFVEDVVICQSKTMEQYLNKNIADKKVIAANIDYLFPRNSINDILKLCPQSDFVTRLDPVSMVWEIYNLLPELEKNEEYQSLRSYIHSDDLSPAFRRYQLALQITTVFDNYIGYRGDWLEIWQKCEKVTKKLDNVTPLDLGIHEDWQSDLWRKLTVDKSDPVTFLRSSQLLKDNIDENQLPRCNQTRYKSETNFITRDKYQEVKPTCGIKDKISKKISIFGISNLPQDYIDFFAILKANINLNFYYLMPCIEYWGDINRAKAVLEGEGNRLLASWGMVGRDFFELLLEKGYDVSQPEKEELIPKPNEISLLEALQFDIIHNNPVEESIIKEMSDENIKNDNSIIINNTYSRMREVEVLHDYILNLLNSKECELSDIVVMAPNIEDYAPYIQAVFNPTSGFNGPSFGCASSISPMFASRSDNVFPIHGESAHFADSKIGTDQYISYKLADCSTLFTSIEAETFMKLLKLSDGKMRSEDLFEIISSEPIMRKFSFSKSDIETMYGLISDANIAWGEDCEHRKEILDEEYTDNNSWEFGFKRILAGYAFDCENCVEDGTLPLSLNNSSAIVAGKLIDICKKIFALSDKMKSLRKPEEWYTEIFLEIISSFFEISGSKNEDILPLKEAVKSFSKNCRKADFEGELPIDVVRVAIEKEFKDQGSGRSSFFRGGVTFCQLLPMRNIPFKAICIIGMNDAEFPRIDMKSGFNLALKEFRRGDRSLRNEDRYIFLETLLACQENFYLSYIGQSNTDNEEIAPSVIVDELLDYFELINDISKDNFVTKHPLHGFDKTYFDQSIESRYSYSMVYLKAAESVANSAKKPIDQLFCPSPLALSDKTEDEFSFDDFISFFISPTKFFLRYRLNINLYDEKIEPLRTSEPFEIDTLDNYNLLNDLLDHKLKKKDFDINENLKASGKIPSGVWGDKIIDNSEEISGKLYEHVKDLGEKQQKSKLVKLDFIVDGFKFTLKGTFDNIYEAGQAFFRPGTVKVKDKLKAWIWHQLAIEAGLNIPETKIIGWDKNKNDIKVNKISARSENEEEASSNITMLVKTFICGLRKPLPLLLHSSPEYINALKKESPEDALKKASEKWAKPYFGYDYDLQEVENFICFGETPPSLNDALKDEFVELAEAIFQPLSREVK